MLTRFKSAIHDRVHGVKINRQMKQASVSGESPFADGFETSSASCSESETEQEHQIESDSLGVDFLLSSICDLRASPFYFYICIGDKGEPTSRKKRRGIYASKVIHSRSPSLDPASSGCLLKLAGLVDPEVTVRFARSAIVGQDTFLGECIIPISLKSASEMVEEYTTHRLIGGSNAVATCIWRIVPFRENYRPSNILPPESAVSDRDKLTALVESVRKCITSLCEEDSEREAKELWLHTLLNLVEKDELNHLILMVSLTDLTRAIPRILPSIEKRLCTQDLTPLARSRVIKTLHASGDNFEGLISSLILSCASSEVQALKYLLNRGGDKSHLMSLIYGAIQSDLLREKVLLKFQQSDPESRIHVISEIDQIIFSAFGTIRQWPEGPIPGSKPLFEALSNDTTFVSNKPLSSDSWNHRVIREIGMQDSPLLTGPKSDLYAIKGGIAKLQSRIDSSKYSNWASYRRLFPEGRFVWFGESLEFAKTLLQDEQGKGSSQKFGVGKVVLVIVMGDEGVNRIGPRTVDNGIVLCSNFIQAAIACLEHNLIRNDEVLRNLSSQFSQIICKMERDSSKKGTRHRHLLRERSSELKIDLERFRQRISIFAKSDENHELVDSVILTPIEAQSPALTNQSAGTDSSEPREKAYETGSQLALDGL